MIVISIERTHFLKDATLGRLRIDGAFFCHTLEDIVRGEGIKVPAETAIPSGVYRFIVSISPRFNREMILLYTEEHDYSIEAKGISFTGVRIHGGNDEDDTEGCPLVAFNVDYNAGKIWGTAEKDLLAKVKELGGRGICIVQNVV